MADRINWNPPSGVAFQGVTRWHVLTDVPRHHPNHNYSVCGTPLLADMDTRPKAEVGEFDRCMGGCRSAWDA